MYFVNRMKIEETLTYIDKTLHRFNHGSFKSDVELYGLERIVQMLIEGIIDVGNMMIDGFIMRDPGSYTDIIEILVDEKVIPEKDKKSYLVVIQLRETVVRDYLAIDHDVLQKAIKDNENQLMNFSTHVKTYLANELGVAHAFSNEGQGDNK